MEDKVFKLTRLQLHGLVVGFLLLLMALFINMAEAFWAMSLRNVFSGVFAYYLATSLLLNKAVLTKASFNYILFLSGFTICYYLFGSANNLIIHLLTISIATVLLYNVMLVSNFTLEGIWRFARNTWMAIYFTLIIELVLVAAGYQSDLYAMFPEETRALGLPAYRSLNNTFAVFFDLNFTALNSFTLQAQAYSQFCIMLTILGFSYSEATFNEKNLSKVMTFLAVPFLMYSLSPTVTAGLIFITIVTCTFLVKLHLKIYSFGKFLILGSIFLALILTYYLSDIGFIRKYDVQHLYDLFLATQIDYLLAMSPSDYLLGVDLIEFERVSPEFEIAYLSYMLASGVLFALVNLIIVFKFLLVTFAQIKFINQTKPVNRVIIEIQIANALFVFSMLASSIHFPVITNYLGTLLFVYHLAFGFYMLKMNRDLIGRAQLSSRC